MVAGVCGGLARRFDVDPLLLRIVVAVLALFGVGFLLYALGWLLIPTEDSTTSLAEEAIGRGGRRAGAGTIVLALLLLVIALGSVGAHPGGGVVWVALLVLAVVGAVLLLDRDRRGASPAAGAPGTYPAMASGATATTGATAADWSAAEPAPPLWAAPLPPEPRPPRERSALFALTASAAVVAVGVLALVDAAGATVPWGAYWALPLAVVGLGLLLGAWYGRSRLLLLLGIPLALGTTAAIVDAGAPDTTRRVQPAAINAAGLKADYGRGDITYDLRRTAITGTDVPLELDLGVGHLVVLLPPDVDASIDASAGVGSVRVLGSTEEGFGSEVVRQDEGADGPSTESLRLELTVGVGMLEVRRG